MQELKFLQLMFNGAAVTSISLDLDRDNCYQSVAQDGRGEVMAGNVGSSEKRLAMKREARDRQSVLKSVNVH